MFSIVLNFILFGFLVFLLVKTYGRAKRVGYVTASSFDDKRIVAADVPARLFKMFDTEYGPNADHDSIIKVGFRYPKFHKISDSDFEYPVDAEIQMHRAAYLTDTTIAKELGTLIDGLQKIGLEFVCVTGETFTCARTGKFNAYLQQPNAVPHGQWKPSEELEKKFPGKRKHDALGRFTSNK